MSPTSPKAPKEDGGGISRRLAGDARRLLLTDQAAEAFAAEGFSLATRAIAKRCGVTQALLYKYFPSKEALVEAVLERRFLADRPGPDPSLLIGDAPLKDRIAAFYSAFARGSTPVNLRLFLRAALDGLDLPDRFTARLDARMLRPVLAALRAEAGAPPPGDGPLVSYEREIVMMLHGSVVFTLIRKEIYATRFPLPHSDLIALHAGIWSAGAVDALRRRLAESNEISHKTDR